MIKYIIGVSVWMMVLPSMLLAQTSPEQLAYALSTRYTPYLDGTAILDLTQVAELKAEAWWVHPKEVPSGDRLYDVDATNAVLPDLIPEATDEVMNQPLKGLHLALDPGHVGGVWAEWEWRNFRISEEDAWVREGELVLEVARRIRIELTRLGAVVSLVRESCQPINPKSSIEYWAEAKALTAESVKSEVSLQAQLEHALAIRNRAVRMAIVSGELAERARVVNEVIRPDALLSLHINAAAWPDGELQLVDSNHAHVLVFGCLSQNELATAPHRTQLIKKMTNGSARIEARLGAALGSTLEASMGLPASEYSGLNAIRIDSKVAYLWARNLMLLRLVECPTVLLEPYVANSKQAYIRIQQALRAREFYQPLPADDILIEYTDAVVAGVLRTYGSCMLDHGSKITR